MGSKATTPSAQSAKGRVWFPTFAPASIQMPPRWMFFSIQSSMWNSHSSPFL